MRRLLAFGLVILAAVTSRADEVVVARWEGAITPVAARFMTGAIERAAREGAIAVVLELDTPGGLDTSMRDIVKAELAAEVPVVVYVAPGGSRAASAGVFITMAAHVAAMAPTTNIGSASPVQMMGSGMDSTMAKKVTNDAVAYLESIANERGRNAVWAARFVEDADNITADEALAENVIDVVARDRRDLFEQLDGRTIDLPTGPVTLRTTAVEIVDVEPGLVSGLLGLIADPTVAYMLLLLGIYGIFFELSNPGSIYPGVIGAVAILLALFALQALPVRAAGIALIGVSVVLFVLEVYVASMGLLGVAGVVALVFGSAMLYEPGPDGMRLGWGVIVPSVAVTGGFVALCVVLAVRAQKRPKVTGLDAMIGEHGRVSRVLVPGVGGKIVVHGEVWDARCSVQVDEGGTVEVTAVEGRIVVVRPVAGSRDEA